MPGCQDARMAGGNEFPNNLMYPGHFEDNESDLYYNWHRYRDRPIGGYLTEDPIGLTDHVNAYLYVENNWISNYDFNGLQVFYPPGDPGPGSDPLPISEDQEYNRYGSVETAWNSMSEADLIELFGCTVVCVGVEVGKSKIVTEVLFRGARRYGPPGLVRNIPHLRFADKVASLFALPFTAMSCYEKCFPDC